MSNSLLRFLGTVGIKKIKNYNLHRYENFSEEDDRLGVIGKKSLFSAKEILTLGHILQ